MLRFVYIGDQIYEGEKAFAFFDTCTDTFKTFGLGDTQVLSSMKELEALATEEEFQRCARLIPEELLK